MPVHKDPNPLRTSTSSASAVSSLPRQSRLHSHSMSAGIMSQAHRVTRRKSMSATAASKAHHAEPAAFSQRRTSKAGSVVPRAPNPAGYPPLPSSLPNNEMNFGPSSYGSSAKTGSAVVDGPPLSSLGPDKSSGKARRRASEGSRLSKSESRRVVAGELRCEKCGKGYKHSSCLTKHLWEHTPEWAYTSKLLISKHQQVQLLEAASVLVQMNHDGTETVKNDSDHSSASSAASGSSDMREDDRSSIDTTPPPQADDTAFGHSNRLSSSGSSVYSRSYQSVSAISGFSESAPKTQGCVSHSHQWSNEMRPATSAASVNGSHYDDDEADLAAAVNLLSCSYGTPKSAPNMLPPGAPPVPPLPARFLGQQADVLSGSKTTPPTAKKGGAVQYYHESGDVDMDEEAYESSTGEEEYDRRSISRGRMDDDEGVFGRMEE